MFARALLKDIFWLFFFILLLFLVLKGAEAASPQSMQHEGCFQHDRTNDINNVLVTPESRVHDREVLKKTKVKICELPAGKLSLMSSLCDRVAASKSDVGSEMAYSLVSAMIVLS